VRECNRSDDQGKDRSEVSDLGLSFRVAADDPHDVALILSEEIVLFVTSAWRISIASVVRRSRRELTPLPLRHRRRARAPRTPQPEHQRADRREGMEIEGA